MDWTVSIKGRIWDDGKDDNEGRKVHVGDARFTIVPDAGLINLFDTLNAVDQKLAKIAEMRTIDRPDLMPEAGMELGGDLLVLSSLWIDPAYRGHKLGHAILRVTLCTVGRAAALLILHASPVLTDDGPSEGSPEHAAAKKALQSYWADYGFQIAARDYLVAGSMADVLGG